MDYTSFMQDVPDVSFADELNKFTTARGNQAQARLMEMKAKQMPADIAAQNRQNEAQGAQNQRDDALKKHTALKGLATDALTKLQQAGISDPVQAQAFIDKYQQTMKPYIVNVLGLPGEGGMSLDQVKMLANSTPQDQAASARQEKVADQQAFMPGQLQLKQAEYGMQHQGDIAKEQRAFNNQKELGRMRDASAMERMVQKTANNANKPLPPTIVKLMQENKEQIGALSQSIKDIDNLTTSIDDKSLGLGLFSNMAASAKNYTGQSDTGSVKYAEFNSIIEGLRNNIMLMAKGTQTEGDAKRALEQILANRNDSGVVKAQLQRMKNAFENDINIKAMNIDDINQNYGRDTEKMGKYQTMKPTVSGQENAKAYNSIQDIADALKSGRIKSRDEARQIAIKSGLAE